MTSACAPSAVTCLSEILTNSLCLEVAGAVWAEQARCLQFLTDAENIAALGKALWYDLLLIGSGTIWAEDTHKVALRQENLIYL